MLTVIIRITNSYWGQQHVDTVNAVCANRPLLWWCRQYCTLLPTLSSSYNLKLTKTPVSFVDWHKSNIKSSERARCDISMCCRPVWAYNEWVLSSGGTHTHSGTTQWVGERKRKTLHWITPLNCLEKVALVFLSDGWVLQAENDYTHDRLVKKGWLCLPRPLPYIEEPRGTSTHHMSCLCVFVLLWRFLTGRIGA